MRRLAFLLSTLVILGAIALMVWPDNSSVQTIKAPKQAQEDSLNLAPRALTSAEQTLFVNLVCAQASGPGSGYAYQCASLPGYPSKDYGGAGLGLGITLQNIIYGHLTSATADEAYVTYAGSFEPHVTNFGGGILFTKSSAGWALKAWYPGGQAGNCVLLTPKGQAHFICLNGWEGQGESDTNLRLTTLPPLQGNYSTLLSAHDLRETLTPNANCVGIAAGQNLLMSISGLTPATDGAAVKVYYVSAKVAQTACAASQIANAALASTTLALHWQGGHITITPALNFGPSA